MLQQVPEGVCKRSASSMVEQADGQGLIVTCAEQVMQCVKAPALS
jgi:hypothetical protein